MSNESGTWSNKYHAEHWLDYTSVVPLDLKKLKFSESDKLSVPVNKVKIDLPILRKYSFIIFSIFSGRH